MIPFCRIPNNMQHLLSTAENAAEKISSGNIIAASGFTTAGDPKATLFALAKRGEAGLVRDIDLITAAQLSSQIEDALAKTGILNRRTPFTTSSVERGLINSHKLHYTEQILGKMPRLLAGGAFGVPDVAIIEAIGIDENGRVIPSTSVGMSQLMCEMAKNVIIELNESQPQWLIGLHDIYEEDFRHCGKFLSDPSERIGKPYIEVNPEKIIAIVRSDMRDLTLPAPTPTETEKALCRNLMVFFDSEFPFDTLPPIQTGIGSLSQAILSAFSASRYQNLKFYCGALQHGMAELLASGQAVLLSGSSISLCGKTAELLEKVSNLPRHLVLRSMEVSNGAAAIASAGIVALNTGIDMDIFGNVNASHISGSKIVNGIGGGATFAANSALSVVLMPSVRKDGKISCIVPATPHTDIIHHDIDIVITENGIADLRGHDDIECARLIIANCAHPDYRSALEAVLDEAVSYGGHHPMLLDTAYKWQVHLGETGSMLG